MIGTTGGRLHTHNRNTKTIRTPITTTITTTTITDRVTVARVMVDSTTTHRITITTTTLTTTETADGIRTTQVLGTNKKHPEGCFFAAAHR